MERAREGSVPGKSNDEATLPPPPPTPPGSHAMLPAVLSLRIGCFFHSCSAGLRISSFHTEPPAAAHTTQLMASLGYYSPWFHPIC